MASLVIEDLVREAKSDFTALGKSSLLAWLVVQFPELPTSKLLWWLAQYLVEQAVKGMIDSGEFAAFVVNTKFLTSEQAADYRAAVAARLQAPEDISNEDWEKLERAKNAAFRDLIGLGR